ncbi:MAG: hypothetical protein GKR97_18255 [Rhizobiaceae bacterium]|nr:hypothetical protein [Rhizobiaceae bacterium]
MSVPTDPAAMQAHLLGKLLQGSDRKPQTESKAPAKFIKQMSEHIETKLRDRLHHEILTEPLNLASVKLLQLFPSAGMPVSILWDSTGVPLGLFRCDKLTFAVLARLCFGGDIESPIPAAEGAVTEAEIGLQQVLARLITRALEDTGLATVSQTSTILEDEFERDEYEDNDAFKFNFEITIGQTSFTVNLMLRQSVVLGATDSADSNGLAAVNTSNDELLQTPVQASVKLTPQPTTLGQIRSLKVGDCLPLVGDDQLRGQFIVSDQEIFDCQIGRSGDAYSLKIGNRPNLKSITNLAT